MIAVCVSSMLNQLCELVMHKYSAPARIFSYGYQLSSKVLVGITLMSQFSLGYENWCKKIFSQEFHHMGVHLLTVINKIQSLQMIKIQVVSY